MERHTVMFYGDETWEYLSQLPKPKGAAIIKRLKRLERLEAQAKICFQNYWFEAKGADLNEEIQDLLEAGGL